MKIVVRERAQHRVAGLVNELHFVAGQKPALVLARMCHVLVLLYGTAGILGKRVHMKMLTPM
ncbi:hypothetical protein [Xanthobacter autotrophicus]|uniref:hypothetical protein n=1 Tax=Xanthobacter autotrophicus TaxID=280 RepID=UPI00372B1799